MNDHNHTDDITVEDGLVNIRLEHGGILSFAAFPDGTYRALYVRDGVSLGFELSPRDLRNTRAAVGGLVLQEARS